MVVTRHTEQGKEDSSNGEANAGWGDLNEQKAPAHPFSLCSENDIDAKVATLLAPPLVSLTQLQTLDFRCGSLKVEVGSGGAEAAYLEARRDCIL
jgi:hypothetical protein